jgi:alpha-L-fucosidase
MNNIPSGRRPAGSRPASTGLKAGLLLAASSLFWTSSLGQAAAATKPIRALMITGGCCHDYSNQRNILAQGISARAHVEWTVLQEGGTSTQHKVSVYGQPEWAKGYDVVVHNECFSDEKDPDWLERILQPHRAGMPAVVIHCAMHCYRAPTNQWFKFVGVTSHRHGSHFAHEVKNLRPEHPIMKGFPAVWKTPVEELYNIVEVAPTATPLGASYSHETKVEETDIWINTYGQGRVFGTTIGHYNHTMEQAVYLDVVTRGLLWACDKLEEDGQPKPEYGPVLPSPTAQQLAWQEMEFIAFAHFGINTFTDREWGDGKEDPKLFAPTAFDARQWVRALKAAGIKLLILTAKHHDGFCLWPSRYTEHSVKNSPWREGKGDVVREVAQACREGGLKFGVYLSPWDRHEPSYGDSPAYNEHFRNQLRELLTNYGDVAEVWFDGACGEGPNGKRQEYDWLSYYSLVRQTQPNALIAICGPDVRWVGNEDGLARENETSVQPIGQDPWSRDMHPGKQWTWYPAECDVSIRPGWFYHAAEDAKVKSLERLLEIYYQSVGRNSVLLLNVPPDRRGLIHESDVQRLAELGAAIQQRFSRSLAETHGQGQSVELKLPSPAKIDHAILMEDIRHGERVRGYVLEVLQPAGWKEVRQGAVIGHKQIVRFPPWEASAVRLRVTASLAEPRIRKLAVYSVSP